MKTALKTPVINSPISKGFSCCTCRQKAGFAHYLYRHLPGFASPSQLPAQHFDCRQWLQSYNPTSSPSPQLSQRCLLPLLGAACCTAQPITDIQHGQNLSFCSFSLLSSRHRRITTVNQHTAQAALLQSDTGRVHQPFCGQRQPQHSRY